MYCENCGTQNKDGATICEECGAPLLQTKKRKKNIIQNTTNGSIKKKTACLISAVVFVFVIIAIGNIASTRSLYNAPDFSISDLFKSDKDRILGDWVLNTSDYGEGLDKLVNLNGVIVEITFLSDGTCTVDGTKAPESGVWSIVDGQLMVQGTTGGMFWNYNGFLADYDLDGDTLTLYGDDGDNDYVYYRE